MLTKMPKVGDVVIANSKALELSGITEGKEYVIYEIDCEEAWFYDDDKDERVISDDRFHMFTLKTDSPEEYPGYIEAKQTTHNSDEATFEVVLLADEKGYMAIKALVERSQAGVKRAELERKIAELQAELDAL